MFKDSNKRIEILAPAGSFDALKAAANAGCDAAYIGGSMFGARAYADNLTKENMLEAIDYMHIRNKKLYLTVNTLLKNNEIEERLYDYLVDFYERGLDAVIVQDMGVMKFIHENFPKMDIHASTQMTLTMAEGGNLLRRYGVTRMVTSRELSFSEVKRIRENTELEIEAFVHGALCYCYSGQCLMSSVIGGRSGNRGRCAQPCRMEYDIKGMGGKAKYLLSPKDMCTIDRVAELIESGIDSFKIEGRMKRYEYAAGVTAAYRKQADLYYSLGPEDYRKYISAHKDELETEIRNLKDLYNRGGFTNGYYVMHNSKDMMSMERPNHSGVYVGEVVSVNKNTADIRLEETINAQDVLEFRKNGKAVYDYTVKDGAAARSIVTAKFLPGSDIKPGMGLYRTKNNSLLEYITKEYYDKEAKRPLKGYFYAACGQETIFTVTDGVYEFTATAPAAEPAVKQPQTPENVKEKLNKTNNTPFYFEELETVLEGDLFIPVGALNGIRRNAIEGFINTVTAAAGRVLNSKTEEADGIEAVMQIRKETEPEYENKKAGFTEPELTVSVVNLNQLKAVLATDRADGIYIDITDLSEEEIKSALTDCKNKEIPVYILMPHIFRAWTYDKFKNMAGILASDGISGYVIKNFEEYSYLMENNLSEGRRLRLDYNMYTMNGYAKKAFYELGAERLTAPVELNFNELKELGITDMELLIYGRLPLMVSAQCVRKNTAGCLMSASRMEAAGRDSKNTAAADKLSPDMMQSGVGFTDRSGRRLKVMTHCRYCYNTIYNPEVFTVAGLEEVRELSPRSVRISLTFENEKETEEILKNYDYFKENILNPYLAEEITRGHFKRGIV